jgi:hypothetical protein
MNFLFFKELGNHGRLGNQLFQIAATIGVAKSKNMKPLFPSNWKYRQYFNIPDEYFGTVKTQCKYEEDESKLEYCFPQFEKTKNTEMYGYFQSEKYFEECKDEILEYLTPKAAIPSSVDKVCFHHRRGDYVGHEAYVNIDINFYLSAYDKYFSDKEYTAISDDVNYLDLHYNGNKFNIKQESEIADFIKMITYKYHVISNSTFAWWAAYLSRGEVVRPNEYFSGTLSNLSIKDLYPEQWHVHNIKEKIDCRDTTFIIPTQYDHEHRKENLTIVTSWIRRHFDTNLIIGEINTSNFEKVDENAVYLNYKIRYFHRTKVINELTKASNTPYVFNWDADVIVSPVQIHKAIKELRCDNCDVVYPYDGTFVQVERNKLRNFTGSYDVGNWKNTKFKNWNHPTKSVGGGVGYNVERFWSAGGENENFISYGPEDSERFWRYNQLGLRVKRIDGWLFHIEHFRGKNSKEGHEWSKRNWQQFKVLQSLNQLELHKAIQTWPWIPNNNISLS